MNRYHAEVQCDSPEPHLGHIWVEGADFTEVTVLCTGRMTDARQSPEERTQHQQKVLGILSGAQEVYSERSLVYKDNYKLVGAVMSALFPEGRPGLKTEQDYNRWHIFELIIVKLTRYATNYDTPHEDSLTDMLPYLAILGALDEETRVV